MEPLFTYFRGLSKPSEKAGIDHFRDLRPSLLVATTVAGAISTQIVGIMLVMETRPELLNSELKTKHLS